jgi:hypothetical protein
VYRVSPLPRDGVEPEAMRLFRENIGLKAQLEALRHQLALAGDTDSPPSEPNELMPERTRA